MRLRDLKDHHGKTVAKRWTVNQPRATCHCFEDYASVFNTQVRIEDFEETAAPGALSASRELEPKRQRKPIKRDA